MEENWRYGSSSKIQISWLKNGDDNTAFFHATIKERWETNGVYELLDKDGKWLKIGEEIQNEIIQFYQNIQGTSA